MKRPARTAGDVNRSLIAEVGERIERAAREGPAPPFEPHVRTIDPKKLPYYAVGPEMVLFPTNRRPNRPAMRPAPSPTPTDKPP
jgi:hypothetical protein